MFIKHFGFQAVSKYAREVWTFVNLYSKSRGCNRFHAVLLAFELLRQRKEVLTRGIKIPTLPALEKWIKNETKLGNATLDAEVAGGNVELLPIKIWSDAVNDSVKDIVQGVPPFPLVPETLAICKERANCIVISQTPVEALEREWEEYGIQNFVEIIAGQEMGAKTKLLEFTAKGKFEPQNTLMIGDAPGDQLAAKENDALFFPINPGKEDASWDCLKKEGLDRFFSGTFAGNYQQRLLNAFEGCLPEKPGW